MDWVWLIIIVVVVAVNGFKKLSEQLGSDSTEPPPPIPPPRPRPPRARPGVVRPPRVPPQGQSREWRVDATQLQDFIQTVSGHTIAPPPIPVAQPMQTPAPEPEPPPPPPLQSPAVTRTPSRGAVWAEALRDRQNIRNIILAAEIIGPPKGLPTE